MTTETASAKTLIITAGIHGDEPEGLALAQKLKSLIKQGGLCGRPVKVVFHGMLNPSGFDAGTREDASGRDLNRCWGEVAGASTGGTWRSRELADGLSKGCGAAWASILAGIASGDVLVVDCHSLDGTSGVFHAGPLGKAVAEGCFSRVARVDTWSTAGTLTSACEALGVPSLALEVSKGESNTAVALAAYQAICTWAAFGPAGKAA